MGAEGGVGGEEEGEGGDQEVEGKGVEGGEEGKATVVCEWEKCGRDGWREGRKKERKE